jgi:hypothetical protein
MAATNDVKSKLVWAVGSVDRLAKESVDSIFFNIEDLVSFKYVGDPKTPCALVIDLECYDINGTEQSQPIKTFIDGLMINPETIVLYMQY